MFLYGHIRNPFFCIFPQRTDNGSRRLASVWYGFSSIQVTGICGLYGFSYTSRIFSMCVIKSTFSFGGMCQYSLWGRSSFFLTRRIVSRPTTGVSSSRRTCFSRRRSVHRRRSANNADNFSLSPAICFPAGICVRVLVNG